MLPSTYADAVTAAGAIALLLPPAVAEAADTSASTDTAAAVDVAAAAVLDGLHGLILSGGADVDPDRYGAPRDAHTGPARADRDGWELALGRAALDRDLPVLAICRGMQVLNVLLGGDLVQHLPDAVGHDDHQPAVGEHGRHPVRIAAGTALARAIGERCLVATYHHQAINRPGRGLAVTAWAEDGTVEAVEVESATWAVGVQWHPEAHDGTALFDAFAEACSAYARRAAATV